jgi:hypothetical protein
LIGDQQFRLINYGIMKKLLIIPICFCIGGFLQAQTLASSVIGSTGEQFASSNGFLDWTLGEIMTETYQQNNYFFTQGFQQPATISVTSIEEEESLWVYPNPTTDVLQVKTVENGDYVFELFNLQGQRIAEQKATAITGTHLHKIDLTNFSVAVYLLRIANTTTGKNNIHKIEKL